MLRIPDYIRNHKILIIIILLSALFLRVGGLNSVIFFEETCWSWLAGGSFENLALSYPTPWGESIWPHPPISPILYKSAVHLVGYNTAAIRFVPMIFGMLSIFMVYKICKRYYNIRTALMASGLMAFSYWHILASLVIDIDGGILVFLSLLFVYSFLRFDETKNSKWLIFSGLVLGISLLTKYTSILIFLVVAIFYLTNRKLSASNIKNLLIISLIGLALFSIFPLLSLNTPETFLTTLGHSGAYGGLHISIRPLIFLVIFGTPLYVGLTILSIRNMNEKNNLFLIWAFFIIIVYSLFLGPNNAEGPYEKYLTLIIPAMCILGGDLLSRIKLEKKDLYTLFILFIISFAAIFMLNTIEARYLDHSIQKYIEEAIGLRWDYNFPIMANTEPGFWVNFYSIALISLISIPLIILLFVKNNYDNRKTKALLIIFIATTFAFNIFFVQEFLFHGTHPDITKVTNDMADYYKEHGLEGPIGTNSFSFSFYLDKLMDENGPLVYFFFDDKTKDDLYKAIQNNATILIAEYYPTIPKDSEIWERLGSCKTLKRFEDKGITMGYIFSC